MCWRTTAMRNDTLLSYFFNSMFLNQAQYCVKRAAHFERADALKVFAFEKQTEFGFRRGLTFPLCSLEGFGCLRA
jgi:hypothetical protein